MFTGIVAATGKVQSLALSDGGARLVVRVPARFGKFRMGESLSVSGVCLTALSDSAEFRADLSAETLQRTILGGLVIGAAVNLERAVRLADRLSGHLVSGHVDGLVRLLDIDERRDSWIFSFALHRRLARYVVEKGSVALDGISLTAIHVTRVKFSVSVIPHTYRATTLKDRRSGDALNFEADVIAKYVESFVRSVR